MFPDVSLPPVKVQMSSGLRQTHAAPASPSTCGSSCGSCSSSPTTTDAPSAGSTRRKVRRGGAGPLCVRGLGGPRVPTLYIVRVLWVLSKHIVLSTGIFKIEDSAHVARLWGIRKNRPAMNYDKLSRSIRQYYKKGIIRKPDVSQRLVYQFVKPV